MRSLSDQKIKELQEQSKYRWSPKPIARKIKKKKEKIVPIEPFKFLSQTSKSEYKSPGVLPGIDFWDGTELMLMFERFKYQKKAVKPMPLAPKKKIYLKDAGKPAEETKVAFVRPPAQYDNKSPYGIADELKIKQF